MPSESLAGLKAAFEEWRSNKRHLREAVPVELLQRARVAARQHGPAAVARATKLDRGRIKAGRTGNDRRSAPMTGAPAFSRLELGAPARRPFAEVEMPTGLKVRLFTQSDEALRLLSCLLATAGAP